jgi:HlyD family secretion protein
MTRQSGSKALKRRAMLTLMLGGFSTIALAWVSLGRQDSRPLSERYALSNVRRMDLYPALSASGRVESSKRTLIECELEDITIGVKGQRISAGGASVILSVIPEGSLVRKGDVLAVLDSSDYEELLRQQRMTVERARADHNQAELDYEIARLGVTEFQEGLMQETIKDFERRVSLARSDQERWSDRLAWSRRMKQKGYVSAGQVSNEAISQAKALFALNEERAAYRLFMNWTAPRTLKELENAVVGAQATLNYQQSRLTRHLGRLAKLEKMVDLCTIRAPHDGFVIYANNPRRDIRIEEGISVHQKQDLFYLPDLKELEVVASLHESIVKEVSKGMRTKVWVEGLPNRRLEGHVTEVASIPTSEWRTDVRYFDGTVKINNPPRGILPGMTARVEIALKARDDVLAVPAQAVASEEGHKFCYVAHDESLERREVKLGESTEDFLEISQGLQEGEQVVLNPSPDAMRDDISEETPLAAETTLSKAGSTVIEPRRQTAALQ